MPENEKLTILVEGNRDETFIDSIIAPILISKGNYIKISVFKYAKINKAEIVRYINGLKAIREDILCLADINSAPNISQKKTALNLYKIGVFCDENIIVVIKEIESWYMAGMNDKCCKKLGISKFDNTNTLNKEEFHVAISKSRFRPKLSCCIEILRNYDIATAISKNKSFNYFYENFLM